MLKNKKFLPKIWLMRQAGRYLPQYMEVRRNFKKFLDLCYDSQKAAEVTIQPIEKFGLSAAIVFADILVTADSLNLAVDFVENKGPIITPIREQNQVDKLLCQSNCQQFTKVRKTIEIFKEKMPQTPIIGFCGGSWTTAAYILEGHGKCDFKEAVKMIYTNKKLVESLIEKITQQNIFYLKEQIKGGCEIIKIFESHAGIVPLDHYNDLIIKPTNLICQEIRKDFPNVLIIGFPRGTGLNYDRFINETTVDVISCDQFVPIEKMRQWQQQQNKIVQGNLDPLVLFSNPDIIKIKVDHIMSNIDQEKFIFNLGHGILPQTPVDNVKFLVDYVKSWQ